MLLSLPAWHAQWPPHADDSAAWRLWQAASDGFDWRGWASESAERAKEPFYGFTEFFKDVEADINRRQKKREAEPKSLYQELSDLGEEFVEWLEGGVGGSTPK